MCLWLTHRYGLRINMAYVSIWLTLRLHEETISQKAGNQDGRTGQSVDHLFAGSHASTIMARIVRRSKIANSADRWMGLPAQ